MNLGRIIKLNKFISVIDNCIINQIIISSWHL